MKIRKNSGKIGKNWAELHLSPIFLSAHSAHSFHSKIPQNSNKFIKIQEKLETASLLLKKYNKFIKN